MIQNIAFAAAIEAFSGSSCGTLSEIGCVKAAGTTGGVTLNLSGLTVNPITGYLGVIMPQVNARAHFVFVVHQD